MLLCLDVSVGKLLSKYFLFLLSSPSRRQSRSYPEGERGEFEWFACALGSGLWPAQCALGSSGTCVAISSDSLLGKVPAALGAAWRIPAQLQCWNSGLNIVTNDVYYADKVPDSKLM